MLEFLQKLDAFEWAKRRYGEEVERLEVPLYAKPKLHGQLPYCETGVAKGFRDKKKIIYSWLEKSLWAQFHDQKGVKPLSIVLFTWVMPGGLGDFAAQMAVAKRLEKAFPEAKISLITLLAYSEKRRIPTGDFDTRILYFHEAEEIPIPQEVLGVLAKSGIVIQLPTYYPYWEKIEKEIRARGNPKVFHVGEYGFLHSEWYHPESGNVCMGVHALEKGLLFGEKEAGTIKPHTYFAYFITVRGAATYLHALLASKKRGTEDLTLHLSHPLPLLQAIKQEDLSKYGLSSIVVLDGRTKAEYKMGEEGKCLWVKVEEGLTPQGVQRKMAESEPFVGCRGDRSFSEVVTQGKFFFYDALDHALPFLQNLYEVARHHLPFHFSLHEYLSILFNRKESPQVLGEKIADLMLDPALFTGMDRLLALLKEEFSFEEPLIQAISMHLYYRDHPEIERQNRTYFDHWIEREGELKELLVFYSKKEYRRFDGRSS